MQAPGSRASSVKRRPSANSTTRKRRRSPVRKAMFASAPMASGPSRVARFSSRFQSGQAAAST